MQCKLISLSINDEKEIYDMLQELPYDENGFINSIYRKSYEEFKQWLIRSENMAKGINLEDWMVPQNTYWLYVDEKPVGIAKIRHYLSEALRQKGGHGGYSMRLLLITKQPQMQ